MSTPNPATDEKLAELRDLALRATPGPWTAVSDLPSWGVAAENPHPDPVATVNRAYRAPYRKNLGSWENDAQFIAAANPATVLALLDRLDAERARAYDAKLVPGVFECKKCGFQLTSNTIHIQSGTIRPNTKPTECSNGCGPMWRVSWSDHNKGIIESYNGVLDKRDAALAENAKLRAALDKAVRFLEQGKAKFAPETTNSLVDEFLADYREVFVFKETP